jgi:hypothetical protein
MIRERIHVPPLSQHAGQQLQPQVCDAGAHVYNAPEAEMLQVQRHAAENSKVSVDNTGRRGEGGKVEGRRGMEEGGHCGA